jgi:hypothetical protein
MKLPGSFLSRRIVASGSLAAAVVFPPITAATTVVQMNLESLSVGADCIVEATVQRTSARWNDEQNQIYTDVQLDVTAVVAGDCATGPRTLTLLGGVVNDLVLKVHGAPEFTDGENVVLFLYEDASIFVPVVGLFQGKLSVRRDDVTGAETIGNEAIGWFDRPDFVATVQSARERGK